MSKPPEPEPIGSQPWRRVAEYVNETWRPDSAPHHAIIAQTRAGKSSLIRRGILPLVPHDRVLVLDSKGGKDQTWAGFGKTVKRFPSRLQLSTRDPDTPRSQWFRLVIPWNRDEAREVVNDALETVARQGDWVVVVDETRHITDPSAPGLGLRGPFENLLLRGGSHGVMVVMGTQAPRWVPSSFYDQAAFAWIGRVRDEQAHKRLLEIGGMSRDLLPTVRNVPRYSWLLNADGGDFLALTKPPKPPATRGQ